MELANVLNQQWLSIQIWEEEGGFIARCLGIPGFVSEGSTREEAMANIHETISGCLEVIMEDASMISHQNLYEVAEEPLARFIQVEA